MNYSFNDERSLTARFFDGDAATAYEYFGAHTENRDGKNGVVFRVWAPNAQSVAVVGSFNNWNKGTDYMSKTGDGVWELFIEGELLGESYKFCIETPWFEKIMKSDPFAFYAEKLPDNASVVHDISGYEWQDGAWLEHRRTTDSLKAPMNIYEVHAGSWKSLPERNALHPRSVYAANGAPLRFELGLSDDRLLRRDLALRHSRGLDVPD